MAMDFTKTVDRVSVNNGDAYPVIGLDGDRYYPGIDLTVKFSSEITQSYSGDPWAWIKARITAGNFDGIHVGDYIPFRDTKTSPGTHNARIMGINTYKNYGDTAVGNHIDFFAGYWSPNKPINQKNYNNGLIPTENVTSDGTSTTYTLTKPMYGVASVKLGDTEITGFTYDNETYTLTFTEAPAAGTLKVTGTGSEYPWLASDAYLFANSLAGHVADGTTVNPAIKRVDYTADGIFYYLPTALKNVIVEKRLYAPKRYSASELLTDDNAAGWTNIGKIWFPTEFEIYGATIWSTPKYGCYGSPVQYPLFANGYGRQIFGRTNWWSLSAASGYSTHWCDTTGNGSAYDTAATLTNRAAPVCFRVS